MRVLLRRDVQQSVRLLRFRQLLDIGCAPLLRLQVLRQLGIVHLLLLPWLSRRLNVGVTRMTELLTALVGFAALLTGVLGARSE